jgi:protein-S-isoprenylcysteine O-methyltransferase Ste14
VNVSDVWRFPSLVWSVGGPGLGNVPGMSSSRHSPGRVILAATRIWLPLAIALAGLVLVIIGHGSYSELTNRRSLESAAGVALLIVALIVWMLNWMYRLSVRSNQDREYEERAREYFDRTGRWPDEDER